MDSRVEGIDNDQVSLDSKLRLHTDIGHSLEQPLIGI
jgi:hypothetical protein